MTRTSLAATMPILASTAPIRLLAAYGQSQIVAAIPARATPKPVTRKDPLVRPIPVHQTRRRYGGGRGGDRDGHRAADPDPCPLRGTIAAPSQFRTGASGQPPPPILSADTCMGRVAAAANDCAPELLDPGLVKSTDTGCVGWLRRSHCRFSASRRSRLPAFTTGPGGAAYVPSGATATDKTQECVMASCKAQ